MTLELYPNDDDQLALLDAQRILAASGVAAPPSGYDLTTLAAAVYARGWAYRIDRAAGSFQAEIRAQQNGANQPLGAKSGWTADVVTSAQASHKLPSAARLLSTPARYEPMRARTAAGYGAHAFGYCVSA